MATETPTRIGWIRDEGRRLLERWWQEMTAADEAQRPTAYTFVMGSLVEILRVFDLPINCPEITALQTAARGQSLRYLQAAEDQGYSADICGYVKADVGLQLTGRQHPNGRVPKPALVIATNMCNTYIKWAEIWEQMYHCTRSVLDIGGQDTKAISVNENGQVLDFCMNDKCSAGTGRFLGAASQALEIPLGDLGTLALTSKNPVTMTTTCTVFAESEILGWLARGRKTEDVLMGVHLSIASRSLSLVRRVGVEPEITFTGGVARNVAMVRLLAQLTGSPVNVNEESHYCGAIGAALYALDRVLVGAEASAEGGRGA